MWIMLRAAVPQNQRHLQQLRLHALSAIALQRKQVQFHTGRVTSRTHMGMDALRSRPSARPCLMSQKMSLTRIDGCCSTVCMLSMTGDASDRITLPLTVL